MIGTITLYDRDGERLHTIYLGAAPEYGKAQFLARLAKEIYTIKLQYPNASYIGIADGAKTNWEFLQKHTQQQILDFYHATEYFSCSFSCRTPYASKQAKRLARSGMP